jgi:hypothetical protein
MMYINITELDIPGTLLSLPLLAKLLACTLYGFHSGALIGF